MTEDDIFQRATIPFAYRLAYLINWYREPLFKRIEDELDLSRPEWTVLWFLSIADGIIASDISEMTGLARNSISRAVISLDASGCIERRPLASDRRASALHLTDKGRDIFRKVMPMFEDREQAMLSGLNKAEQARFMSLLEKLAKNVPNWK